MKIRYIVTVADFGVRGHYMFTCRKKIFNRLDRARKYEGKMARKCRSSYPNSIEKIERWGTCVHNFINGMNGTMIRETGKHHDLIRYIVITCQIGN